MPYTDAVIHQVQRFADIIPMNLPHRLTQDTAFCGFLTPKGTNFITLLNTVHDDPSQFLTPQEFNPKHFWMPISPSRRAQPSRPSQPVRAGSRVFLAQFLPTFLILIPLAKFFHSFLPPILSFGCTETFIPPLNSAPISK
ncbi:PREDICTED: cytochrome P450 2F1-like [Colobus angolensis palliatus]|uniref:cytochrome P450 2F1-like n=1 Tax=Colobus angolensis palliatus TaxID=336983 RepID=UPI0005F5790A|nr:PREDICTED: cytochrome P450 2F1-like [Colobus angolensis palliatus]